MATVSILKNVDIRDKEQAKKLVYALEHAKGKKSKKVVLSKTVKEIDRDMIKSIFGK